MERNGEVEMTEFKAHGLHLLYKIGTGQMLRVKGVWMDLGTLGKQMRFGTVREEIGMRDDCDRPPGRMPKQLRPKGMI